MKANLFVMGSGMALLVSTAGCALDASGDAVSQRQQAASSKAGCDKDFVVMSPDFADGDPLPTASTCEGAPFGSGVSPELNWTKGPKGTKSYAIVFVDTTLRDAGQPNFAYHWAIWNIPKNVRTLPAGIPGVDPNYPPPVALPDILGDAMHTQARGVQRFFGPCPAWQVTQAELCGLPEIPLPNTDHYAFIVYALPEKEVTVPAYDSLANPNYVDTLNAFFASMDLGSAEIHATSNAVPTTTPPVQCPPTGG